MPSIKLKRLKAGKTSTGKVLVRKKPVEVSLVRKPADPCGVSSAKATIIKRDNVITKPTPVMKLRPKPKPAIETTVVDDAAKAYNITLSTGDNRTIKGYAVTALGNVLNTTGVTATRWVASGLLPKPIFDAGRGYIYHVEEVRSFYRLLTEHQKDHRQYRPEHSELRRRLFEENASIRRGLFPTK